MAWWSVALSELDVCARISRPEWPKRLYILMVKTYLWLLLQTQVYNVTCLHTYMLWTKLLLLTAVNVSVIFFLTREEGTCTCNGNSVSKIRHNLKLNFDFIIWNWGDVILNVNADLKKKILKFVFPKFKSLNYFIELNNKTGSYVVLSEIHKLLILNQVKLFKFNLWKTTLNLRR